MNDVLKLIPAVEGVRKVSRGEGEQFDIAGAHLTWKVKAEDSAFAFSINEMTLASGEGVPVHSHTSAESFYVLEGAVDFFRVNNGQEDWIHCEMGELVILPPNALHGFYNRSSATCRVLGVSTGVHQTFFDAVVEVDRESSFASMPIDEAMGKIAQIALKNHMYFAPINVDHTPTQGD
jgi:quercetin dioxygenase-like cupin family protein